MVVYILPPISSGKTLKTKYPSKENGKMILAKFNKQNIISQGKKTTVNLCLGRHKTLGYMISNNQGRFIVKSNVNFHSHTA